MKKSYAVLGLGKFGKSIAEEMAKAGAEVMVVDNDEESVNEMADTVTYAVKADICDVATMKSLGLSNMDGVVVAITDNLDASIMGTILSKEAGVPYVIAKSSGSIHTRILEKVGADKVIVPERESGIRVARNMLSSNYIDFIELSDRIRLVEVPVKQEWVGKTLKELNLRKKEKINVIAIRKGSEMLVNLDPDVPMKERITLLVMVDRHDLERLA